MIAIAGNLLIWILAWLNVEAGQTTFALTIEHGCVQTNDHVVPVEMGLRGALLVTVVTIAMWRLPSRVG